MTLDQRRDSHTVTHRDRQEEFEDKVTAKFNLMGPPEISSSKITVDGYRSRLIHLRTLPEASSRTAVGDNQAPPALTALCMPSSPS